jgi:hypothetical protein
MITSGGKWNPAKLDIDADTRPGRRRINQACPILFSTDATVPGEVDGGDAHPMGPVDVGLGLGEIGRLDREPRTALF